MTKRRTGMRLLYQAEPGESVFLLLDGSAVVIHPEREPKLIQFPRTGGMTITPLKMYPSGEQVSKEG